MAEQAGSLSFGFEADFSGFTRAADSAGATLDRLAGRASAWAETTASGVTRTFDTAAALQAKQAAAMRAASQSTAVPGGLTTAQLLAGQTIDTDYLEADLAFFEAGQIPNIPILEIRP